MLRQAREGTGISVRALASKLGVSHTTVSRWETGFNVPGLEDVATVLAYLGVTGPQREQILTVARGVDHPDWLATGQSGAGRVTRAELERKATAMTEWIPLLIPGLLQTADYARATISRSNRPGVVTETGVLVRLGRRDALTRLNPMRLTALIGEPAIHGGIGGPPVMLDQLRYLLQASELPTVELRIVPVSGEWHPGMTGPFILYDFADDPSIVSVELHRAAVFLYNTDDVLGFKDAVTTLVTESLSHEDSRAMIAQAIKDREAGT